MAKLGSVQQHSANGHPDVVVSLCSLGVVMCMVVAVLGIKFRWFKRRIHFDQIPNGNVSDGNGQVFLRSSRSFHEEFSEPVVAQGIFRKKLEEDLIIERPKSLPPVRIRKTSRSLTSFRPPKRNETPSTVVEEPVVKPPPPPPLPPSISSLSLSTLGGYAHQTSSEEKVNFSPSVEIIPNGDTKPETEPLNNEDVSVNRQLSGRKQTGFVRPSDDIIAELQKLSDQVTKERENHKDQPPQPLPRGITSETPKEKFKKNSSRTIKSYIESHNQTDDKCINSGKLGQRRLTGIFPSSDEDLRNSTDSSDNDDDSDQKPSNKVIFRVDFPDEEERTSPPPPEFNSEQSNKISPPLLFITQVSNDEDEADLSDSWSAVQRHRNLTQEIYDQQEVPSPKENSNTESKIEDSPKTHEKPDQPKPRTMRDMKRNNARSDLLLNSERDYNEL